MNTFIFTISIYGIRDGYLKNHMQILPNQADDEKIIKLFLSYFRSSFRLRSTAR